MFLKTSRTVIKKKYLLPGEEGNNKKTNWCFDDALINLELRSDVHYQNEKPGEEENNNFRPTGFTLSFFMLKEIILVTDKQKNYYKINWGCEE
ncbi:hypothetical protein BpHYR1_028113 [Brachionus plicatilis]|uniref:Uncharacterized protein n=1 Tax=Brachionus plicatilis TaxID=10195 RepID=A0A3M7RG59_BRAPC|nr:hypothetical protein BpHYR1_028113 [Brachionus plicatilis]